MFAIFYGFNDTERVFFSLSCLFSFWLLLFLFVNFTRHGIYKVPYCSFFLYRSLITVARFRQAAFQFTRVGNQNIWLLTILLREDEKRTEKKIVYKQRQKNFRTIDTKPIECNIFRSDYNLIAIFKLNCRSLSCKIVEMETPLEFLLLPFSSSSSSSLVQ